MGYEQSRKYLVSGKEWSEGPVEVICRQGFFIGTRPHGGPWWVGLECVEWSCSQVAVLSVWKTAVTGVIDQNLRAALVQ